MLTKKLVEKLLWRAFMAGGLGVGGGLMFAQTGELLFFLPLMISVVYMAVIVHRVKKTGMPSISMGGTARVEDGGIVVDAEIHSMDAVMDDKLPRVGDGPPMPNVKEPKPDGPPNREIREDDLFKFDVRSD